MRTHEQLRQKLYDANLDDLVDHFVRLARPCARIKTQKTKEDSIPVGGSKFGGGADVPEGFQWPEYRGRQLAFLGQIDLPALAGSCVAGSLPPVGLLSFFYDAEQSTWGFDPEDRGSWRVFHFAGEGLQRVAPPTSTLELADYKPCSLTFEDDLSLPTGQSQQIQDLGLAEYESAAYWDVMGDEEEAGGHQLFGHPMEIQGEMQLECQLASNGINCGSPAGYKDPRVEGLRPGASQWLLLLQIDSDDNAGWMWGDMGRLYFWIRQPDIEALSFDDVWMVLQCG